MLSSMAFTQSDLDKINTAIATGSLSVSFSDRTVTYRSIESLIKAKNHIAAELASTTASSAKMYPRHQIASFRDD
jgi:ABC-type Zn uptake system ZnuABC Zn-binding protein ZnuA